MNWILLVVWLGVIVILFAPEFYMVLLALLLYSFFWLTSLVDAICDRIRGKR